jgi:hypothetical protein
VWWEGEAAVETNFPKQSGFSADTFAATRNDILSEGDWLTNGENRAPGEAEAFARYRVDIPKDGTYTLYTRKFWQHGPFRWRFGEGEWLRIPPFPLGNGFSSEIIRTRRPLLMFTQREIDEKTLELNALQVGDPPKSWLGVPMLFGGQVIGLIIVQDVKLEYRFTIQDERLLSMLATQVAVVVRNARLLEATRRQAQQERLTKEISDCIRRQVDVESILKTTTDEISRALGARRARLRIDTRVVGNDKLAQGPDNIASEKPGKEVNG